VGNTLKEICTRVYRTLPPDPGHFLPGDPLKKEITITQVLSRKSQIFKRVRKIVKTLSK